MQVIDISEPGTPDVLHVAERPIPVPKPDEVLLEVAAAGVNRPDCLQRRGLYPPPPNASDILGLEVAGRIVSTGDQVEKFSPDDLVCALLSGGGYAEYCVVPALQCLPIPAGLDLAHAAAVPETFFTVWTNVFQRGQLQAGESLLVHGGASGIGTTAIQLATALNSIVYATAGSDEKTKLCEKLGAVAAVNYREADFLAVIKELTNGNGVDLIFDIVGGSYLNSNIKLLKKSGRLVVIGVLGGAKGELNLGLMLSKHITITGSTLRARSAAEKGAIAAELHSHVWPLLENGSVRPTLHRALPLSDAAQAHTMLENNEVAGKLVLIVNQKLAALTAT